MAVVVRGGERAAAQRGGELAHCSPSCTVAVPNVWLPCSLIISAEKPF